MARIHLARNDLRTKYEESMAPAEPVWLRLLWGLISVGGMVLCLRLLGYSQSWGEKSALWAVLVLLLLRLIRSLKGAKKETEESKILRAGLEGEQRALAVLKGLNRHCHVFVNLRIPHGGGESETDLIVVAPAGVTIIEVKNTAGLILGDTSDEELQQQKERITKNFRNPFRQVGTHTWRLAGCLRSHGVQTHVRRCVFFVNEKAEIRITDSAGVMKEECPLFISRQARLLRKYVSRGPQVLGETQLNKTVELLERQRQAGLARKPRSS